MPEGDFAVEFVLNSLISCTYVKSCGGQPHAQPREWINLIKKFIVKINLGHILYCVLGDICQGGAVWWISKQVY